MDKQYPTAAEIRAAVKRGKAQAAARIDREMGAGSFQAIAAYSASDKSRRALDGICNAIARG